MNKIDICSVEDLEKLRNLESGIYYVYLHSNIYFNDYNSYRNLKSYYYYMKLKEMEAENYKGFKPIELYDVSLIFEGYKHQIHDLYINRQDENNVGLLNCIGNSKVFINNLEVIDATIKGKENVGILGGNLNGNIKNCYISGSVNGLKNTGVICGASNDRLKLTDSSSYGAVTSFENGGALCGKSRILVADNFRFFGVLKDSLEKEIETTMCPDCFMFSQTFSSDTKRFKSV